MSERPDPAPGGAPDDLAPGASWADFRAAKERFLRGVEAGQSPRAQDKDAKEASDACQPSD